MALFTIAIHSMDELVELLIDLMQALSLSAILLKLTLASAAASASLSRRKTATAEALQAAYRTGDVTEKCSFETCTPSAVKHPVKPLSDLPPASLLHMHKGSCLCNLLQSEFSKLPYLSRLGGHNVECCLH